MRIQAAKKYISIILYTLLLFVFNLSAEEATPAENLKELIPICDSNDPSYKKVGGRNICKRECRIGEIGPSGKLCVTKSESGSEEKFCDCGV